MTRNGWLLVSGSILLVLGIVASYFLFFPKPNKNTFIAPGNNFQSPKGVEDYFVGTLRETPEEAKKYADIGVAFYVTKETNINAIISNLAYYGLVRDAKALKYALENTKDTVPGKEGAIKIGANGTIDLAYYDLSREMDTWQVADTLLNKPHFYKEDCGYLFMPGDPKAVYGDRKSTK